MKKKISKFVFLFALLIPFFMPTYFEIVPSSIWIYRVLQIFTLTIVTIGYIQSRRFPSTIVVLFILYEFISFFLTYHFGGQISLVFWNSTKVIELIMLIDYFSVDLIILLNALSLNFEILIYTNLFTLLFCREGLFSRYNPAYGMTKEWFLGSPNNFLFWILPSLFVLWAYKYVSGKSFRTYFFSVAVILTTIINSSATTKIIVLLFFMYFFFSIINDRVAPIYLIIGSFVIYVLVVFVQNISFIEPIVVKILGKKMTFSNRIYIWKNAVEAIVRNPFGYGLMENKNIISVLGNINGYIQNTATHAHNNFLQILFQSGICGFIIYITILIKSVFKIFIIDFHNDYVKLCTITIVVYIFASITEPLDYPQIYIVFPIMYNLLSKVSYSRKKF